MKKFFVLLSIFSIFFSQITIAQESATEETQSQLQENSAESSNSSDSEEITFDTKKITEEAKDSSTGWLHENDGKKHYLTALGFVAFWDIGLCSYNRYVSGSSWAKVGWEEWDHFWERKLAWDHDWYWTNFVLHPYQGSMYYMAARGSNLNKIESFGLTVLGSASWEYLCETNAPSINDMVYTTVGAFPVGEMLYRLSLNADEIHDLLGFAVNPTRVWTQLFTRQKPNGSKRNIHEFSIKTSIGNAVGHTQIIDYDGYWPKNEAYPVFISPELYVVYNDPYGHDSNDAYSQFELAFGGGIGKGSGEGADCSYAEVDKKIFYNIRIVSNGMIFSRAPDFGENKDTTVGLVLDYDFDWHSYYLLSSLAPGFAIKQRIKYENSKIEWQAHLAGIVLGTTDYYFYRRDFDEKYVNGKSGVTAPYNYTTGFQTVLKMRYLTESGFLFSAGFRGYAMYDFYNQLQYLADGSHGTSPGWDLIGITNIAAEIPLSNHLNLGISDEFYAKRAFYKYANDLYQFVNTVQVYAKFKLK
ncbi:DUF3943 domain-containing protein [Treponema zioleckii]|uniref:DUF3943 domain-containing protein n=1 Tax=Treponema zioleckii TaxID=331680 RepID=UPI00168A4973|nr:DUF3943 domain-containing protein [Treponema zioleckii]